MDTQQQHEEALAFVLSRSPEGFQQSINNHLRYTLARSAGTAEPRDWWLAVCHAVRDRIMDQFMETQKRQNSKNVRRVYYFSLEYLMGRLLKNNLINMGLLEIADQALEAMGLNLAEIREEEPDMGLGNGGLGRLAACFLDSLATLDYPAVGYGIHYEFGLFKQEILQGKQVEHPDNWLKAGTPWQIARPEYSVEVKLYGRVKNEFTDTGDKLRTWIEDRTIVGVPWDIPIVGYGGKTVNFLRLWESKASEEFDFQIFNDGGYVEAVREKAMGETISKVLYPNDATEAGKELRLVQQYFFAACSLHDIIRRHKASGNTWDNFHEKVVIQLNDTHPAISVAELMRILVDEETLGWDRSWEITQQVFAYTNHTLLPEALEIWPTELFQKVLPRHLQIIREIDKRFKENELESKWPGNHEKKESMGIIGINYDIEMVRMAYLSTVASFSVNGVAKLHTELLKKDLMPDFHELYPGKFNNKTNGITPRRWLKSCNPRLSQLIDAHIGSDWITELDQLKRLEPLADDTAFQQQFMQIKHENKKDLVSLIRQECGIEVSPDAIFDVLIKRLHEYKRQLLKLLYILTLYYRILHNPDYKMVPRVFIFGAKAAPGYKMAKDIIHAINAVATKINSDDRIQNKIKVAFLPNYNVSIAAKIIPAADVSEQISTAGKEASGTGNMKLALNGALTLGTLDGANVEIKEEVGDDNIFIFGHTVDEVKTIKQKGYNPRHYYDNNPELKHVLDWLCSDYFGGDSSTFASIKRRLLDEGDPFLVLADYADYCTAQYAIDQAYQDTRSWAKMAILNTARVGKFSSDRTIHEYAKEIWNLPRITS